MVDRQEQKITIKAGSLVVVQAIQRTKHARGCYWSAVENRTDVSTFVFILLATTNVAYYDNFVYLHTDRGVLGTNTARIVTSHGELRPTVFLCNENL